MFKSIKQLGKKAKALGVVATGAVLTTASQAAVTFDRATGELTGNVEMGAYYSGTEILFGVLGITIATGLAIGMLMRAKRG
jgi:transketolase N-terminal domain/subunit